MNKNLRAVIAVVAIFLGFLIIYSLGEPDQPGAGATPASAAKTH
jgi:hypothetical protein